MLPINTQRDQGTTSHKVLQRKCTSFTSKKNEVVVIR